LPAEQDWLEVFLGRGVTVMVDRLGLKECLFALSAEEGEHNILTPPCIGLVYLPTEAHLSHIPESSLLHISMEVSAFITSWGLRFGVVLFFRRSNFFGWGVVSYTVALLRPIHRVD